MTGEGFNRRVSQLERDNVMKVKGTTIIDHYVRVRLELNLEEYVLMDFIHNWNQRHKKSSIKFGDYYAGTGIIPIDLQGIMDRLRQRNMLVKDSIGRPDVCGLWREMFNVDEHVKELWKLHNKGNLATVKIRLPKVLKMIPFSQLKERLIAYIDSKEEKQFLKGLHLLSLNLLFDLPQNFKTRS